MSTKERLAKEMFLAEMKDMEIGGTWEDVDPSIKNLYLFYAGVAIKFFISSTPPSRLPPRRALPHHAEDQA